MPWLTCLLLQALDRAKSDAEKLKKLVHGGSFRRLVCANTELLFLKNKSQMFHVCIFHWFEHSSHRAWRTKATQIVEGRLRKKNILRSLNFSSWVLLVVEDIFVIQSQPLETKPAPLCPSLVCSVRILYLWWEFDMRNRWNWIDPCRAAVIRLFFTFL